MVVIDTALVDKLRAVTLSLLDESRPAFSLRREVLELKSIFEAAGGLKASAVDDIASGETVTRDGVAISPMMASMCLDDFARTVQFIRGMHASITDVRKTIDDRPVRILYAGCGPWAPLAVPLMTIFPAHRAIFTLLDIHPQSIGSVKSIVNSLNLSEHVESLKVADAMSYSIGTDPPPDIVLVEMMRAGLEAEPQVAVSTHLMRQAPEAVMIPQEIRLDLVLINSRLEFAAGDSAGVDETALDRDRVALGPVFVLNKDRRRQDTESSRDVTIQLPDFDETRYRPMLLTTVHVYGEHSLKDYDSGITCPRTLPTKGAVRPADVIEFIYELGSEPRLLANRS